MIPTLESVQAFVQEQELIMFRGHMSHRDRSLTITWEADGDNWREFIRIGKLEGTKVIIIEVLKGTDEHADDVGLLVLGWIKDGVHYQCLLEEDWFFSDDEQEEESAIRIIHEALAYLKETSAEAMAAEMEEFCSELSRSSGYEVNEPRMIRLFWESKGVADRQFEPELQVKVTQVESMFKAARADKERGKLERLINEATEWARSEGIKRLTRADVESFLSRTRTRLSKQSRDVLYSEANFRLRG
ncbi:MAG: hypothetical protein HY532_03825 [Chloroflexi bacterium]|nr:hypothetical protein [Chloroflexota bacterium]